jgi:dTDP-4-amino-4,6-dideoxygalactose transaminase
MSPDEQFLPNSTLLYCGSEGLSLLDLLRGLLPQAAEMPQWEQLAGRTVLPTFLGRVAVWQLGELWRLKPDDEVLMPAYNCGTEVDPFLVRGCKVVLYRVDEKAQIDVEDLMRRRTPRTKVVYVTHYFGWPQDIRELAHWCRAENLRLVEDCALALFSSGPDGPLGLQGDAAIFSVGKFLPVAAGGLLTLRADSDLELPQLRSWPREEMRKRTLNLLLKDLQRQLERVGLYSLARRIKLRLAKPQKFCPANGELPDMPADYYFQPNLEHAAMPELSSRLLGDADVSSIRERRRSNYLDLERKLECVPQIAKMFDKLPLGTCPLAFPIILPHDYRAKTVSVLGTHGVCIYPFWEGYHRQVDSSGFPEARYLKDNVLTLPVNQSLSPRHMSFIANLLKGLLGSRALAGPPSRLFRGEVRV